VYQLKFKNYSCGYLFGYRHYPTTGDSDVMEAPGSLQAEISRIAARLPPFWTERPAAWFAQAEAQFHLAGLSNELTKFYHVISQLDQQCVIEVEDINNSPPRQDPYTTLKTELVKRLWPSRDQRTRQLFTLKGTGDRKPSQFLRHLKSLAPDILDNYLRLLWTSLLATNIQTILAGMPEVELDAEALCANRIMETVSPSTVVSTNPGPALAANPRIPNIKVISSGTSVDTLLSEFPDLTRPTGVLRDIRRNTVHHIRTTPRQPVNC
jgi:hypothetical protein